MILEDVHKGIKTNTLRKRVGRGPGSGHGKTSGRGHKGAGSRAGNSRRLSHEGGQVPMARRIAKRGFNNKYFAVNVAIVNLSDIENVFQAGAVVDPDMLKITRLVQGRHDVIKILGDGDITKALTVKAHRFSKSATEKIVAAGGTTEVLMG
ncbi:MAG: 50S ribosomal protein L15 [Planctomycetota bacterium]